MTINIDLPKDWRSTLSAIFTAAFGFVILKPHYFPAIVQDVAGYAALGGLVAFGVTAGDAKNNDLMKQLKDALAPPPSSNPLAISGDPLLAPKPSDTLVRTMLHEVEQTKAAKAAAKAAGS